MKNTPILFAYVMALFGIALSTDTCANDGFGETGLGGVILSRTNDIAMAKEVLDVGYSEIRVAYDFVNESSNDIESVVSFPMPKYGAMPNPASYETAGEPMGFEVSVDGRPVEFKTKVSALFEGMDITAELQAAGLSEAEIANSAFVLVNKKVSEFISSSEINALVSKGFAEFDETEKDYYLLWDVSLVFYWKQMFRAGEITKISHRYNPYLSSGTASGYEPGDLSGRLGKEFCFDRSTASYLDKMYRAKSNIDAYGLLYGTSVRYILVSANSWKDGIRDFTLRLHKREPSELISLCFPEDFHKVDALTFEVRLKNFSPREDLRVYFGNIKGKNMSNVDDQHGVPPRDLRRNVKW